MSGDNRQEVQNRSRRLLNVIIDKQGFIVHPFVTIRAIPAAEHGKMTEYHGIVVHQTDSTNAASALSSATQGGDAAHFIIDKDGTVYQIASIYKFCWHVGKLKSRKLAEHRCSEAELKKLKGMKPTPLNQPSAGRLMGSL